MLNTTSRGRAIAVASLLLLAPTLLLGAEFAVTPDVQAALDRISADSLKGHVSFLASDLLEGRNTPSAGLDIAAEYIAAQFRRAGLEPGGDDGYFETARFIEVKPNLEGFWLAVESGGRTVAVEKEKVTPGRMLAGLDVAGAPLLKASAQDLADASKWTPEQVRGKVVLTEFPAFGSFAPEAIQRVQDLMREGRENLARLKPAAVIMVMRGGFGRDATTLVDPGEPAGPPTIRVNDPELRKVYEAMQPGETGATVSLKIAAPTQEPAKLRNVVGILRGSDPALKDTYVLVSAHYDHIGICSTGSDRICNGADDDASGTASVMELASALAKMRERPKRSLVFIAYFGEEKGLVGSRYYGRHPIAPLEKTVADINLEQLGRTDDSTGPQVGRVSITGFDYTDIGATFAKAGQLTGIAVFKDQARSDSYFARSDNQALADLGIPAHTLVVAYEFPDYHRPGDEWQKLDYANMEKVDRMIAAGLLMIAGNPEPPKWNEANPKTERYVKAWKQRMGN
ncbi:MAG: M28 family peptidase [Bryobacteraceae bacterium]|jgi:hypothetical protein